MDTSHRASERQSSDSEGKTRDQIRRLIADQGPVSAKQIAEQLQLTPAAVRRHLDALQEQRDIEVKAVSVGPGAGRPARRYVLSSQGQSHLGDDYLHIAQAALRSLAALGGPQAIEEFAAQRFAAMESRYASALDAAGDDVAARAEALSIALQAEGYHASSSQIHAAGAVKAIQLCQGHCPVLGLATEFPEFCAAETAAFTRMLGVDVRRLATQASGGHVCTTHIPTGRNVKRLETPALRRTKEAKKA